MAMNAIKISEKDQKKKMNGIGVISTMLSKASHVQMMLDNGELSGLPQQILDLLIQSLGSTDLKADAFGIDFRSCEFDMSILCVICIVKAISYKYLRQKFLQIQMFLPALMRLLYNIARPDKDITGLRNVS